MKYIFILFIFIASCYSPNNRINERTPPLIVIAKDTGTVVILDGDNKIFTIYRTKTSHTLSLSLEIGDTIRYEEFNIYKKNKWE